MVNTIDLENTTLSEAEEVLCPREAVEETTEVPEKIVTAVMIESTDQSSEAIVEGEEVVSAVEVGAEEVTPAQTMSQPTKVDMKSSRELEVVTHLLNKSEFRSDTCPVFKAYL